jgi:hypothetical protein
MMATGRCSRRGRGEQQDLHIDDAMTIADIDRNLSDLGGAIHLAQCTSLRMTHCWTGAGRRRGTG